jgi:hypothetical protein
MKIEGSGSVSEDPYQRHGSANPDPHQNVMDPQHCLKVSEDFCTDLHPLVRGMDPRIRTRILIRTKISRIQNTDHEFQEFSEFYLEHLDGANG